MNVEVRELTQEELASIIKELVTEAEKYPVEARFILKLDISRRVSGCGYMYNYGQDYEVLLGEADIVILGQEEYDCEEREEIAIIPKTTPTVVALHEWDEHPGSKDTLTLYVFDGKAWRSMTVQVPKSFSLYHV